MKLLKVILLATAFVFAADYAMAQGTIDGVVFNDADGNGVADPGELVEPGVSVSLVDAAGNVIATVVTDANGAYSFTGVNQGTFRLRFTYPTTPPLTVQTNPFPFDGTGTYNFNAPVVSRTTDFNTTSPNLSVVNPAGTRGPGVSPFKP